MTPRLFLAVPSYNPSDAQLRAIHDFGEKLEARVSVKAHCALIELARAELESRFMASDCSHILWNDDDVNVELADVRAMLEEDLGVVGLACRNRHSPERQWNVKALHHGGGDFAPRVIASPTGRRLIKVAGLGFGCILVRRTVVERLWRKHSALSYQSTEDAGRPACMTFLPTIARQADGIRRFVGEDFAWCTRAQEGGYPVHVMLGATTDHAGLVDCFDTDSLNAAPVQLVNRAQRRAADARR